MTFPKWPCGYFTDPGRAIASQFHNMVERQQQLSQNPRRTNKNNCNFFKNEKLQGQTNFNPKSYIGNPKSYIGNPKSYIGIPIQISGLRKSPEGLYKIGSISRFSTLWTWMVLLSDRPKPNLGSKMRDKGTVKRLKMYKGGKPVR